MTDPRQFDERRPLGCALAMSVLQSDLYRLLDDVERADCDELVARNLEWVKGTPSSPHVDRTAGPSDELPLMNPIPSQLAENFSPGEWVVSGLACRNYARLYALEAVARERERIAASSGSLASDGDHPGYAHIGPQPELVAFKSISEGGLRHEAVPMGTVEAMRRWEALPDGTPLFAHFNAAEASDGGAEIDRDDDGELLIDWSPGPGRMVTLSLRADGRLSYAFTWDGETAHGTAQMPSDTGGNDGR